ncbi:hypothetical protein B0T13DRAFT_507257 [Neurospora crassa]|nr:hypothetical protein B0T13DRAFT_507257 [Neurospora crassa]
MGSPPTIAENHIQYGFVIGYTSSFSQTLPCRHWAEKAVHTAASFLAPVILSPRAQLDPTPVSEQQEN